MIIWKYDDIDENRVTKAIAVETMFFLVESLGKSSVKNMVV